MGLLPQSAITPEGITVADLVGRGRYPHQQLFNRNSAQNAEVIQSAMRAASLTDLAHIPVDSLSGGQRQRAWVAMVLAQQTPLYCCWMSQRLFLDISHQIELLELFKMLIIQRERTIVAVLHDLNHASRYADHLIVMKNGEIIEKGSPQEIITPSLLKRFRYEVRDLPRSVSNTPMVVPLGS